MAKGFHKYTAVNSTTKKANKNSIFIPQRFIFELLTKPLMMQQELKKMNELRTRVKKIRRKYISAADTFNLKKDNDNKICLFHFLLRIILFWQ